MRFWILGVCAVLVPVAAWGMQPSAAGVGANGYDWLIGSWTCTNAAGVGIGGPVTQTITFKRNASGLTVRVTGKGFERSGYLAYVPSTRTWWKPISYPNGNHYVESTTQTGSKTVWTGPYTDVTSGATFLVRDTYTIVSPTQYADVGQYRSGSVWKTGYRGVCKKAL